MNECLAIFRKFGNQRQEAFVLHNLGMTKYHQGELGAARSFCTASLAIKEQLGDADSIASTLVYMAQGTTAQGEGATSRIPTRSAAPICCS